jgi:hypothetical protein
MDSGEGPDEPNGQHKDGRYGAPVWLSWGTWRPVWQHHAIAGTRGLVCFFQNTPSVKPRRPIQNVGSRSVTAGSR